VSFPPVVGSRKWQKGRRGYGLVALQELFEFRHSLHEAVVKQLTGGDPITVRLMCQEFFEYVPTFKIFLSTNYKPRIVGTDDGIWRRAKLVNFNAFFDEKQKDMNLPRKLFAEREGVVNWLIEGYKEWKRIGLAYRAEPRPRSEFPNSFPSTKWRLRMTTLSSGV